VLLVLAVALSGPSSPASLAKPAEIVDPTIIPPAAERAQVVETPTTSIAPVRTVVPPPVVPSVILDKVSLTVDSDPIGADVLIDGRRIGVTPFRGVVVKSNKPLILTVRRVGFASVDAQFRATEPILKRVALKRLLPKVVPAVKPPPPVVKKCVSAKDYNPITDGNRPICE
jgi:hypothetical protein